MFQNKLNLKVFKHFTFQMELLQWRHRLDRCIGWNPMAACHHEWWNHTGPKHDQCQQKMPHRNLEWRSQIPSQSLIAVGSTLPFLGRLPTWLQEHLAKQECYVSGWKPEPARKAAQELQQRSVAGVSVVLQEIRPSCHSTCFGEQPANQWNFGWPLHNSWWWSHRRSDSSPCKPVQTLHACRSENTPTKRLYNKWILPQNKWNSEISFSIIFRLQYRRHPSGKGTVSTNYQFFDQPDREQKGNVTLSFRPAPVWDQIKNNEPIAILQIQTGHVGIQDPNVRLRPFP